MNRKIRKMMREIERRGGKVGVSSGLPDHLAEQILRDVLECPDCCDAANDFPGGMLSFDGLSIDRVLAGSAPRSSGRGH
jgi:hypothetical protein